jgi:hypothetical protein
MLRHYWSIQVPDVVVLDFDLSWHKGSLEASVVHTSAFGYLAPEQLERRSNVSTRHAAVDAFGLGMTLFFMAGRQHPIAEQHRHTDWAQKIHTAVARLGRPRFPAVPRRFGRLIEYATRDMQSQRWDVAQILAELSQLRDAEHGSVSSAELLAEGLLAGSEELSNYEWDHEKAEAIVRSPNGLVMRIRGNERNAEVEADFDWATAGSEDRRRVGRWIPDALRDAEGILRKGGWRATYTPSTSNLQLSASIGLKGLLDKLSNVQTTLERARQRLTFVQ